jgi:hypothetical protein
MTTTLNPLFIEEMVLESSIVTPEKLIVSKTKRIIIHFPPDSYQMNTLAISLLIINIIIYFIIYFSLHAAGVVLLLGDSLVINTVADTTGVYSLNNIMNQVEIYPKVYYTRGYWGDRIATIASNIEITLEITKPIAVVLLWDSDVTDVDESKLNANEIATLREHYIRNLRYTINAVLSRDIHIIVTGPGLMLCCPDKDNMLNDYLTMNKNITTELGVDYIDLRQLLLSSVEKGVIPVEGSDRDHMNKDGLYIAAQAFSKNLDSYWRTLSFNHKMQHF